MMMMSNKLSRVQIKTHQRPTHGQILLHRPRLHVCLQSGITTSHLRDFCMETVQLMCKVGSLFAAIRFIFYFVTLILLTEIAAFVPSVDDCSTWPMEHMHLHTLSTARHTVHCINTRPPTQVAGLASVLTSRWPIHSSTVTNHRPHRKPIGAELQ